MSRPPFRRRAILGMLAAMPVAAQAQPTAPQSAIPGENAPQPELPKEKLVIVTKDGKSHEFMIEMALEPEQQRIGLMFRPSVPENGGMLFDWGTPRESSMWMRNTISSLDMVFINQDGTIRAIAERTIPRSLATVSSRGPVRATLELAAGTTERLNIRVGDKVQHRIFSSAG
jgi:uncharacterized membrane protein (UPF0127 family)